MVSDKIRKWILGSVAGGLLLAVVANIFSAYILPGIDKKMLSNQETIVGKVDDIRKQIPKEKSAVERLAEEGRLDEAKALQDKQYSRKTSSKNSINASSKIETLKVTNLRGMSVGWRDDEIEVSPNDYISFALHYYVSEGLAAKDVKFFLDDLNRVDFSSGQEFVVNGKVTANNFETATGQIKLVFTNNTKLTLSNISWQSIPCKRIECGKNMTSSRHDLMSDKGLTIGDVEGSIRSENSTGDTVWTGHWAGSVVATFHATSSTSSL